MSDDVNPGRPQALNDRDALFSMFRDTHRQTNQDIAKLWGQQARTLNRFSRALEQFHKSAGTPTTASHGILGNIFNKINPLHDKDSLRVLGSIEDSSHLQVEYTESIDRTLLTQQQQDTKYRLYNEQMADRTLKVLNEILKAVRSQSGLGGGGGLLNDISNALGGGGGGKGKRGLEEKVATTAAKDAETAAKDLTEHPGFIKRLVGKIPGAKQVGRLFNRGSEIVSDVYHGATALPGRLASRAFSALPEGVQAGLNVAGRGAGLLGRITSPVARLAGKALAPLGELAAPLAAIQMPGILSDISNERGTPLLGNEKTGGLLGSRLGNYAQMTMAGASVGAAAGAPLMGIGALPGALIGGAAGLGTAVYDDYKPQVDKAVGNIISGAKNDLSGMWSTVASTTTDAFDKLPDLLSASIPGFSTIISEFGKLDKVDWSGIAKTLLNTVDDAEDWLKSKFNWNDISNKLFGKEAGTVNAAIGSVAGGISSAAGSVSSAISSGAGAIKHFFGGGQPSGQASAKPITKTFDTTLNPAARGLLDTIAGTESPGYNVMYGGKKFTDYSQHPDVGTVISSGPNAGLTSTAAGRYQFTKGTWDEAKSALGLKDFTPASQDKAAWWLAQHDYNARTHRDLAADLKSDDPKIHAQIGQTLSKTWTSLPGGIEAGTNDSKFATQLAANTKLESTTQIASAATTPTANAPIATNITTALSPLDSLASSKVDLGLGSSTGNITTAALTDRTSGMGLYNTTGSISQTNSGGSIDTTDLTTPLTQTADLASTQPPVIPPTPTPTSVPRRAVASNSGTAGGVAAAGGDPNAINLDSIPLFIGDNGLIMVNTGQVG